MALSELLATTPHAVRWAQRQIFSKFEMHYSKWHWTNDANFTICGRPIQLIADGPALLPETYDDPRRVTCKRCRALLTADVGLEIYGDRVMTKVFDCPQCGCEALMLFDGLCADCGANKQTRLEKILLDVYQGSADRDDARTLIHSLFTEILGESSVGISSEDATGMYSEMLVKINDA